MKSHYIFKNFSRLQQTGELKYYNVRNAKLNSTEALGLFVANTTEPVVTPTNNHGYKGLQKLTQNV
jgi:hypothetical protein